MDSVHKLAIDQALTWINANYSALGIIVSGSIVRGNPNPNSDLDIFVIHQNVFRQRVQKFFNNIPCEIFINNIDQIYEYFEREQTTNRPVTANIISTGKLVQGSDNKQVLEIIKAAEKFSETSKNLAEEQMVTELYSIATLFEDAEELMESDTATSLYALDKAVAGIVEYIFLFKKRPLPRLKDRITTISEILPASGQLLISYFNVTALKDKIEFARQLILSIDGKTGFFEWSTKPI